MIIAVPDIVDAVPAQSALEHQLDAGGDAGPGIVAHMGAGHDFVERLRRYLDQLGEAFDWHAAVIAAERVIETKPVERGADGLFFTECRGERYRAIAAEHGRGTSCRCELRLRRPRYRDLLLRYFVLAPGFLRGADNRWRFSRSWLAVP